MHIKMIAATNLGVGSNSTTTNESAEKKQLQSALKITPKRSSKTKKKTDSYEDDDDDNDDDDDDDYINWGSALSTPKSSTPRMSITPKSSTLSTTKKKVPSATSNLLSSPLISPSILRVGGGRRRIGSSVTGSTFDSGSSSSSSSSSMSVSSSLSSSSSSKNLKLSTPGKTSILQNSTADDEAASDLEDDVQAALKYWVVFGVSSYPQSTYS